MSGVASCETVHQTTFLNAESYQKKQYMNYLDTKPVPLRSPSQSKQSSVIQRRSLNISHYNALQNAVSNLSRIDDYDLEELGYGFFSDVFKVLSILVS